ncbi:MAG: IclR family transcriptional regulator [Kiritimatiellae bacterium]|nr:IclR family transcriptional regulator [Kiritimatiellia bacterium]
MRSKTGNHYAVPAVDAMLDIVEHLSGTERALGVTELSRALGLSTNLTFRVMKRLVERGYADADAGCAYRLGAGFFRLGMALYRRFDLRLRARPHLERLAQLTGETCQIEVPDGARMLVLDVVAPPADYYLQVVPGASLYPHGNAFGKAVLAFLDAAERERLLPSSRLARLTSRSTTSRAALMKELAHVRTSGVAHDHEEYADGIFCVGAPVFDVEGKPAAGLGVTGLSSRFDASRQAEIEHDVLACARDVAHDVGYAGDFYERRMRKKP